MCGIVGFTGPPDRALLATMNERQRHRGPDDGGEFISEEPPVSMAARRLSIIDIEGGHQPMVDSATGSVIVFNGEIFNAPELRGLLTAQGIGFQSSHSDTEVVLKLYLRYGSAMVTRLRGMFAFAIFDRVNGSIFGARDRFGIKPLYLSRAGNRFAFASELKSLLALPWITDSIDLQAVFDYLSFQAVPAPRSIFRDVEKLPPATWFNLELSTGRVTTERYWRPTFDSARVPSDPRDLDTFVRESLREAVVGWSQSDVPISCSLSGGIDSSSVVALFAESCPGRLKTFTVGFEDAGDMDERDLARAVASRWGTEHNEIVVSPEGLLDELDTMIWHLDEPYAGGLPSWFVFQQIAGNSKVALTGVGGDELFGSYGKWIPYLNLKRRALRRLPGRRPKGMTRWRHGSLYHPLYFDDHTKRTRVLAPDVAVDRVASEQTIEDLWRRSKSSDPRDAITHVDLDQQLPNEFLHMVDRFSMAHSVEARTPFLDHVFVENILSIPASRRTHKRALKGTLIRAMGDLLPREVIGGPKRGFVIPQAKWLRAELRPQVQELLGTKALERQGIFRPMVWSEFVEPFLGGRTDDHPPVWTLLMFQMWCLRHRGTLDVA